VKLPCKSWPLEHAHPAFPKEMSDWGWIVRVKVSYRHSPQTKWFEAWVDSGSPWCLFHADFCKPMGIQLESGVKEDLKGIVGGAKVPMYFHKVQVFLGSGDRFDTMAGFSSGLSVAGILGRRGFFENFHVHFDASDVPPSIEISRINRA
jgi:hypothetical protein